MRRRRSVTVLFVLAAFSTACVKQTTLVQHVVTQQMEVKPREPGPYKPKVLRTAAFMPFQNTAFLTQTAVDVNIAFANEQIAAGMAEFQRRTGVATLDPNETQSILSDKGLTTEYAQVLRDYNVSGLIDVRVVRKIAQALRADVIVQGLLIGYTVDTVGWEYRGVANQGDPKTKYLTGATARWLVFDASSGRIEWNVVTSLGQEYRVVMSVDQDKTLAHVGMGLTAAIALAGIGVMLGAMESDSPGTMLIAGGVMMLPVCFAPIGYGIGSRESRVVPSATPLMTMDQALARMIQEGLQRVAKQFQQ
jgi:hypothetical protein